MSVAIFRQLSAAFAAQAAAFRQAADELEGQKTDAASEAVVEKVGKGNKKSKAADVVVEKADPLAALGEAEPETAAVNEALNQPSQVDPLAGLMDSGGDEEPAIGKEQIADVLGKLSKAVDGIKGEGQGRAALVAMFKKHGATNMKDLKEEEFLGIYNESNTLLDAISKMKK